MIYALTTLFLISVIGYHVCAIRRHVISTIISKTIASLFFVIISAWVLYHHYTPDSQIHNILLQGNIYSDYYIYIFIGLIFGFAGDVLLAFRNLFPNKRKQLIASGMITFGFGHLAYMIAPALSLINIHPIWLTVPCIIGFIIAVASCKLAPRLNMDYGKFKIPVMIYSFIILFLLLSVILNCIFYAHQTHQYISAWIPIIPVLLFTISDFMLSTNYFDKEQKPMSVSQIIIIHVTYYLAQLFFALGWTMQFSV